MALVHALAAVRRAIQTADGIAIRIGNDVSRHCSAKNLPRFAPKSPPTLEKWEHQKMIVETTCCARACACVEPRRSDRLK